MNKSYQILFFDLDDTLFDTWGQLVSTALVDSCSRMIAEGLPTDVNSCLEYRKEHMLNFPREDYFKKLCQKYVTDPDKVRSLVKIGHERFYKRNLIGQVSLHKGVEEMLGHLQHAYKLYLVTAGNFETQNLKIKTLGIEEYFTGCYCVDQHKGQSKEDAFKKVMKLNNTPSSSCLSIGNRMDNEIKIGKSLGMDTCYVLQGEYTAMQPSCPEEKPDFCVEHIAQVYHLLEMPTAELEEIKRTSSRF